MKWLSLMASKSIKLIIASVFIILAVGVRANPLPTYPPEFFVSELRFDSLGKWVIKLSTINFDIPESVDSVCITTSSGSVKMEYMKEIFMLVIITWLNYIRGIIHGYAIRNEGTIIGQSIPSSLRWKKIQLSYLIFI